ncbi:hypothetical protein JCM10207_006124 [Rhodosporidiobolus poonsookiae]
MPPSPIAKLPSELLLHIFTLTRNAHDADLPSYSSTSIFPFFRRRVNPVLAISHTCKAWNTLTISTPSLWSSLHLDGEIDEERASEKAHFWAGRAWRHDAGGGDTSECAISTIILTRVQDWTDDYLTYLCDELELVHHLRLRTAFVSFRGGGAPDEYRQLQSVFRFLLSSGPTLASLTLHTSSHLRILFSLPRLGHSFTALESLEICSTKLSSPAADSYLVPAFLPRYNGEPDWAPLASLRRLILIGPVWRLRFRDGTVASPTLASSDVPALRFAHLSSTSPPVHWDLLSHPSLTHLHLEDWFDHRHLADPDLSTSSFSRLTSLSLARAPALVNRLLNLALGVPGLVFPALEELCLAGASFQQQTQLDLFAGARAPRLRLVDLNRTTDAVKRYDEPALVLPALPRVERLVLVRAAWVEPDALLQLVVHHGGMPRLKVVVSGPELGAKAERGLRAVGVEVVWEDEEE